MNEQIVAAAILLDSGLTVTAPKPARHSDLIQLAIRSGAIPGSRGQGFLTSTGRWVDRIEAGAIALEAKQILSLSWGPELFTEDLW